MQKDILLNNELMFRKIKGYKHEYTQQLIIKVERTLPFEYVSKMITPFLSRIEKEGIFSYSDYDTSIPILSTNGEVDIVLFWTDWRLYMDKMEPKPLLEWLKTRLSEVDTSKPILINNWPTFWELDEKQYAASVSKRGWIYEFNYLLETLKDEFNNIEIIDMNLFASQMGMSSYDARNDEVSNYPLSNQLTLQLARHIALNLIPAMLEPKLKAIVLDLDNTLYSGVLGEDGIEGIQLTEEHIQLQKVLMRIKENGILLAISSKNNKQDVLEMLEKRKDFPLDKDDFTFMEANWKSKADNIRLMAKKFNFDVSAMLFIDDNPAEIALVKEQIPTIHTLMADATGKETVHRLLNYPFLYSRKKDNSADLRQKDILANQKRVELEKKVGDSNRYLASLQMKISVFENESLHLQRIYEMGQKTNQFNLALHRFAEGEIQEKAKDSTYKIYTVALSDMLNDSGIIGTYIVRLDGDIATFEEILFSCRALGRNVEDASLQLILSKLINEGIRQIKFESVEGPRNSPALEWLNNIYISPKIADILKELNNKLKDYPAEVCWQNERNH
ncbi:HAD-IIIC family phosphatase [Lysinibacillus pakistanensis]|uniref:HAD-IIIC family phosphatase n=1 Tax=Lysinibacillus pakistanensis TaxID=759811 RepID=A0AAX3WX56_9BACI|nr:HAD-IIIC family phosphatase [Lysinibacillus pakistanensis]MDM5231839.1 HAD-IIIC family phosphatase [Lysinibacillus pakistanensis]WHY47377.1 HAD-IIIC family phosphatase [Lysinibacillus pakistanensis]WHY52386.1 HAD-IIIC family phosphatase [Lysinibacillus pakistanensis]